MNYLDELLRTRRPSDIMGPPKPPEMQIMGPPKPPPAIDLSDGPLYKRDGGDRFGYKAPIDYALKHRTEFSPPPIDNEVPDKGMFEGSAASPEPSLGLDSLMKQSAPQSSASDLNKGMFEQASYSGSSAPQKSAVQSGVEEGGKYALASAIGGPLVAGGAAILQGLMANAAAAKRDRANRRQKGQMMGYQMEQKGLEQSNQGVRGGLDSLMAAYRSALLG